MKNHTHQYEILVLECNYEVASLILLDDNIADFKILVNKEETKMVEWLVLNHLLMSKTAFRYEYEHMSRLFSRTSVPLTHETHLKFENLVQKSFDISCSESSTGLCCKLTSHAVLMMSIILCDLGTPRSLM